MVRKIKTKVVWGAPASGKSTYVTENRGDNDITFDFDILMQSLAGKPPHEKNDNIISYLLDIRDLIIEKSKEETKLDALWMIVTWVDDEFKKKFEGIEDIEYIMMDTTEETCLERVEENEDRQVTKEEQTEVIKEWFRKFNNKKVVIVNMKKPFWRFSNKAKEPDKIELRIDGDIVSDDEVWLYDFMGAEYTSKNSFKDQLKGYDGKDITVWIDSYGGDVFAATGIYNALMEHTGKITVKIDGKAMSAGSIIAMAGGEILMSPGSIMMIHNPMVGISGYYQSDELIDVSKYLDEVKESIINSYQLKTNRTRDQISKLLDEETYFSAKKAIKEGFADGMLYDEKQTEVVNDFSFNRLAVVNSATNSIKRYCDLKNELDHKTDDNIEIEKAKLNLKLKLGGNKIEI